MLTLPRINIPLTQKIISVKLVSASVLLFTSMVPGSDGAVGDTPNLTTSASKGSSGPVIPLNKTPDRPSGGPLSDRQARSGLRPSHPPRHMDQEVGSRPRPRVAADNPALHRDQRQGEVAHCGTVMRVAIPATEPSGHPASCFCRKVECDRVQAEAAGPWLRS